jgi:hypothetical protein
VVAEHAVDAHKLPRETHVRLCELLLLKPNAGQKAKARAKFRTTSPEEVRRKQKHMRRYLIASLLMFSLATPGFAATKYYLVIDTVGNCAAIESEPSAHAGMKIIGNKGGYDSADAAKKALKDMKECKGVVE